MERGNRKEIGNILKRGSGHGRKASGIIGGTRQASGIIGRDDIIKHKGRTFELFYTIVKRELICVNEEVKSDMWER